jgi:outer membrane protein assembly factor BamB
MKKFNLIRCLLVVCFFIANAGMVNAQNWKGWRGNNRNGTVAGFTKPAAWPSQLNKIWEIKVGLGDASPVMANNKIFLHVKTDTTEVVLCLDAANGKEIWRSNLNPSPNITGPAIGHPGPRSTPFIEKEKLYTLGTGGVVTCLEAKTGKVLWKNDAYTSEVPQFYTACSPLVYDGKCIVQLGGKTNGVIVAFDAKSGKEIWKIEGRPTTYSSPAMMTGNKNLMLVQSETNLLGVSTDGKLVWEIPTPAQRMFYNAPSPVFDGLNIFIAGQGSGTKAYLLTKTGDKWESRELWVNKDFGVSFNTPLLKDGFLYGNEAKQGKLFCLNANTGALAWTDATALNRFASILDLGDVLACLPATGQLIFFEPSGKAYKELAKYKVAETDVYAHPLFIGDKIFVKDKEMLTCWSLK